MIGFAIGMVPIIGEILLVVNGVINAALDGFTHWRDKQYGQPPDYSAAEEKCRAEDWAGAAAEFNKENRGWRPPSPQELPTLSGFSLSAFQLFT